MKDRKTYGLDRVGLVITRSPDGYKVTTTPFMRDNIIDLGQELVQGGQVDAFETIEGTIALAHLTEDGSFDSKGFKPEGSREIREALESYMEAMKRHLDRAESFETVTAFVNGAAGTMVRDNIDPAKKTFKPVCVHCQDNADSIMGVFGGMGVRVISSGNGFPLDLTKDEVLIPGADCILPGDYQADYNAAALAKFNAELPVAMVTSLEYFEREMAKLQVNLEAARNRLFASPRTASGRDAPLRARVSGVGVPYPE